MSKSDQRKGLHGTRQWRWPKDVNAENRNDEPGPDDVKVIVDVDYYIDMPDLLATEAKPVILYTCVPSEAAFSGAEDMAVCFDADGSLLTKVAGGGQYSHHLWDYGSDSILATKKFLGVPYRTIAYAVERKQVTPHRQLILLAPIRVFSGVSAVLASLVLKEQPLKRFNPIVSTPNGSFVRFLVHRSGGTSYTTGRPLSYLSATVDADVDAAIATVARLGTTNLMLPTVASWLPKDCRKQAALLTEYHRAAVGTKVPTVYPVELGVRAYQYEPKQYDQEARPKLQAFMSPMVHGAFAPVPNDAGERRCVEGRVEELRRPEPKPNTFRDKCMEEFVDFVCGNTLLEPVDHQVVVDKQTKPAQKLSLAKAMVAGETLKRVLKNFIKSEAYPDVKDPRNISMYNDSDKLDMATFSLAVSAHLKQFKWYGPGMTPDEIAARVRDICVVTRLFLNSSDLRRMDGFVTYVLRGVDRGVCMRLFANHRAVMNELLKRNVDNRGSFPHGTTYEQGPVHGSGCSATSVFQTMRATFIAYLGFRRAGLCPLDAWEALGIHFGDDGLDADLPPEAHEWAAKQVGQVLETIVVERGDPGVTFLARYYSPEVWYGDVNSMCDVKRQLAKLHTTVRLPSGVTAEQKVVEKSMGYVATDRNTPVLGEFCSKVLELSEFRPAKKLGVATWWSQFDGSVQYPNENVNGWMDTEFERLFPEFDRDIFNRWLSETRDINGLLSPPLCAEPRPATPTTVDVVVDNEVLPAKPKPTGFEKPEDARPTKVKTQRKGDEKQSGKSRRLASMK
jgi:hypothetical protein